MLFHYLEDLQQHSGILPPDISKPDSSRPSPEMLEDSHRDNSKKIRKKRNWSEPKSYRIIFLLNYLGKIAEKIITARLIYLAEITDILHFDQINRRRKKSAINIVMTLIYDIQVVKQDKKVTSVLFI